jgi:ADP-L-glycero-D-manno-heptose 6-epimerase
MNILVTGGTGFIGSNLALALQADGHDVTITGSMYEQPLPEFAGKTHYLGLKGIVWEQIGALDAVFHQGGISDPRITDRTQMLEANLETSKIIFKEAKERGVQHIIYASSTAVYGNLPVPYKENAGVTPLNVYGESKAMLDEFAMDFASQNPSITVIGLRYCNVYGPRENHKGKTATMIYQFAQQMKKANPKLFTDGTQKRDYIYVKDVVEANKLALKAKQSCVVNCGSGSATSFNELVEILNETLGLSRTPEYIDNPYTATYQSFTLCDMNLAKERLDFAPHFDIRSGIADYLASGFLYNN